MQQLLLGADGLAAPYAFYTSGAAGDATIQVYVEPPLGMQNGTTYTAIASPGSISASKTAGPNQGGFYLDLTGLTNGTTYSVNVTAVNRLGSSSMSAGSSIKPSYYIGHSYYSINSEWTREAGKKYNGNPLNVSFFIAADSVAYPNNVAKQWRNTIANLEYYEYKVDVVSGSENISSSNFTYGAWTPLGGTMFVSRTNVGTSTTVLNIQVRKRYEDQAVLFASTVTVVVNINP